MKRASGATLAGLACLSTWWVALWSPSGGGDSGGAVIASRSQSCGVTDVKITQRQGTVGAGTYSLVLRVTNESFVDCTIDGYPVVRLLDAAGAPVASALDSLHGPLGGPVSTGAPSPLTLAPGQTASALLGGTDMPLGTDTACPSYSFDLQLPRTLRSAHFPGPVADCSHVVVGPFVTGFNGLVPTGDVTGTTPRCPSSSASTSGLGESVRITANSGSRSVGSVTEFVSPGSRRHYDLVLAPGRYLVTSTGTSTERVVVRAGRVTSLGTFGHCTPVPTGPPTTLPGADRTGNQPSTTTTTTVTTVRLLPECGNDEIAVVASRFGQAGGSASELIAFENVGTVPCSLTGFPGVAVLDRSGLQVEQATRLLNAMMGGQYEGTRPVTVALAPAQEATATVEGSDVPFGRETDCPFYPAFLVTPPDQTRSVTLPAVGEQGPGFANTGFPGCSRIVVTPVVPGDTGSSP